MHTWLKQHERLSTIRVNVVPIADASSKLPAEKLHVPATPLSALVQYAGDEGSPADNPDINSSAPAPCLAFDSGRAFWWSERVRENGALALRSGGEVLRETGWERMQQSSEWRWNPALVSLLHLTIVSVPSKYRESPVVLRGRIDPL